MDPLTIVMSELNLHSPTRADSFDLHLSRQMTHLEREALPQVLSQFAPAAEVKGPQIVTLNKVSIDAIERGKDALQQLVSEAEALAKKDQDAQYAAPAQAQASIEDAAQRAAAIDWT